MHGDFMIPWKRSPASNLYKYYLIILTELKDISPVKYVHVCTYPNNLLFIYLFIF